MKVLSKPHTLTPNFDWEVDSPALQAKLRMVKLPTDESRDLKSQFLFVSENLWVPISVVNGNIHILPGVPSLCNLPPPFQEVPVNYLTTYELIY